MECCDVCRLCVLEAVQSDLKADVEDRRGVGDVDAWVDKEVVVVVGEYALSEDRKVDGYGRDEGSDGER